MANAHQVTGGMFILSMYQVPGGLEGLQVDAQHDVIYCGPNIKSHLITAEDKKKLDELGWHFDEETECWAKFT